jgi:hypothetical protein
MAIIFQLWAECKDEEGTRLFADYFTGLEHTLLNGRTIKWTVEVTKPSAVDVLAVMVWSKDLSRSGVRTLQDALETTEAGLRIYTHLKAAPEFRFARVGWEVDKIAMAELPDYVETGANGYRYLSLECAVDEALYRQLGSPKSFQEFRKGYWWHSYHGERYQPLYSNDQEELNQLCRKLLPEYFSY